MYLIFLMAGTLGFILMTLMGATHGFGGHHSSALGHSGPVHGFGPHGLHGGVNHTGNLHAHSGALHLNKSAALSRSGGWGFLMALSPLNIFSLLMGFGATGVLLGEFLHGLNLIAASSVGAVAFTLAVIRPFMSLLLRFASRPSEGLEGEVASVGEAITRFDALGRGLVRLCLDEQHVQLLATLESGELSSGVQVAKGDPVVIVSVDATKNTCTVSRELALSVVQEPTQVFHALS